MHTAAYILKKYDTIIQEEVNVKEVKLLPQEVDVEVAYIPHWQALWPRFGKDTSRIIAAAKSGNTILQHDGTLVVNEGDHERVLLPEEYEVRYSGLQEDHQTVEGGVIVSLNMHITDVLRDEGVAREISRFLNQMRKDAQYKIDAKVAAYFQTTSLYLEGIMNRFSKMLRQEALLISLENNQSTQADITSEFTYESTSIMFQLRA